jgi:tyrosyl-tRNA synthetase
MSRELWYIPRMSKLSDILKERGYVYQHSTPTLEELVDTRRTLYLGVDPTADSMHVGQLQGILVLRRFLEAGHKLIIIVGGGTGMVGDPGGKSAERNLMDDATIDRNAEALRKQFSTLFGGIEFTMVNNAEWLRPLNLMEFLRDVGKHFTVNEMIKRDSVRPRLETPDASISYTEFSYMLLQAYDFLHLHEKYGCDLQVGGSDQWGNIVSGVELIRKRTGNSAYAFSWPLLVNKTTGKKFGKSEDGTVWLDAQKTTPFKFYQFWLNVEDESVEEFLLKMTLLPKPEIDAVMSEHSSNPGSRVAQKKLAQETTRLAHGQDALDKVQKMSELLFGSGDFADVDIAMLKGSAPTAIVTPGTHIADALVAAQLAGSKREARQFISDGAVTLNGKKVDDLSLDESHFVQGAALLKRGKRNVCVLLLSDRVA